MSFICQKPTHHISLCHTHKHHISIPHHQVFPHVTSIIIISNKSNHILETNICCEKLIEHNKAEQVYQTKPITFTCSPRCPGILLFHISHVYVICYIQPGSKVNAWQPDWLANTSLAGRSPAKKATFSHFSGSARQHCPSQPHRPGNHWPAHQH